MAKCSLIISSILRLLRQSAKCLNSHFKSSFMLQTICPRSSVTPTLAGPSGRRPPGMWRWWSPSRSPAVVVATWLEGHARGMAPGVAELDCRRCAGAMYGSGVVRLDRSGHGDTVALTNMYITDVLPSEYSEKHVILKIHSFK